MFRYGENPEQQPDVSLVPPVRLLDLLTAPCAYPVTGKNGFQFHGVLSCDIALDSITATPGSPARD